MEELSQSPASNTHKQHMYYFSNNATVIMDGILMHSYYLERVILFCGGMIEGRGFEGEDTKLWVNI